MSATEPIPLVIVAAVGRNGAIGRDGQLPWTLPSDLAHFRRLTMGTPMIMGRRTYESIGRALPGRETIVVSRSMSLDPPDGIWRAADPDAALVLATSRAVAMGAGAISLIGGAILFEAMMPMTTRLHLTRVDLAPEADTYFPAIDPTAWREVSRVVPPRQAGDEATCAFVDYARAVSATERLPH